MINVYAISLISFKEGLRQRVLYGVLFFAFLMMSFAVLFSGLFLRDISKVILDFCLAAINVGGLLVPFFLAINLLARDIERRTIVTILSRPVSRSQYIIGKFIALMLLTALIMGILTLSAIAAVWVGKWVYGPRFFTTLSINAVLISILVSYFAITVLNALVVLWCSITTSAFIATLLILFTYVIGQTIDDVVRFISLEAKDIEISATVRYAVDISQYLFPNLAAFDLKFQAAHGLAILAGDIAFLLCYAAVYSAAALSIAILIFTRRDFS